MGAGPHLTSGHDQQGLPDGWHTSEQLRELVDAEATKARDASAARRLLALRVARVGGGVSPASGAVALLALLESEWPVLRRRSAESILKRVALGLLFFVSCVSLELTLYAYVLALGRIPPPSSLWMCVAALTMSWLLFYRGTVAGAVPEASVPVGLEAAVAVRQNTAFSTIHRRAVHRIPRTSRALASLVIMLFVFGGWFAFQSTGMFWLFALWGACVGLVLPLSARVAGWRLRDKSLDWVNPAAEPCPRTGPAGPAQFHD